MSKVGRAVGHRRVAPGMLAQLEAAMADAWAALDGAWKRLAAQDLAARAVTGPAVRPADGFRLGGGGGDPSTIDLP